MRGFLLAVVANTCLVSLMHGQGINWHSINSYLPKAAYSLHFSRDGELYTFTRPLATAIYKYLPPASNWSKISETFFTKLTIVSQDLAIGFFNVGFNDNNNIFILRNNLGIKDTITLFGDPSTIFDLHVGQDTTIYYCRGGHGDGIIRSKDLGLTWDTLMHVSFLSESILKILTDKDNVVYAQTGTNIYRTDDEGVTWDTVYDGLTWGSPNSFVVRGDDVFVLTTIGNLVKNKELIIAIGSSGSLFVDGVGYLYYSHSRHTYQSKDDGLQWDTLLVNASALPNSIQTSTLVSDSSGVLYCALADGMYVSTDHGDTWAGMTEYDNRRFSTFGITADSILYGNASLSFDGGFTWEILDFTGLKNPQSPTWGKSGDLITISKDTAKNQLLASKITYDSPWSTSPILPFQDNFNAYFLCGRFPTNEVWAINADGRLSVLDNVGNWHNTYVAGHPSSNIFIAAITDSQTIIATGPNRIYRSADKGKNFSEVVQLKNGEAGIVISSRGPVIHVLTSAGNDYYSTNNGVSWSSFIMPAKELTDIDIADNGALYVSTTTGVFQNLKGFNNPFVWEEISGNLKGLNIQHLAIQTNKRLYAATPEGNIYYTDLPKSGVPSQAENYEALTIYPNPAHDRCYLSGSIALEEAVVECYNVIGKHVLRVQYHDFLDISALPSGMYQVILRTKYATYRAPLLIDR